MKYAYPGIVRESQVLALLLRAAGLSSLALATACADRPVTTTEGATAASEAETETTTTSGAETETTTTSEAMTDATTTTTTTTETTATTAATETTTATTTATSDPSPTTDFPECPIDYYDTVECFAPPGDDTTGGDTTGDTTDGEGSSTTEGTTGDTETTGTTTGGGLCDGFEPDVGGDCGLSPVGFSEVFEQRGQCCVTVTWESTCCGRPFLVEETARRASVIRRGDWRAPARPALAGLSARERATLAAAWAEDGLMEHASVAAFARFALQLLALGAPASLVEAAQQAMADEIAHARLCFGLAAAYGGEDVGPSALPLAGALHGADDLAAVAAATLREGCVGETIAAMQAEAALSHATDAAVRAAQAQIAADELRHAELAWRFVAWALERGGPEVHAACTAALVAAQAAVAASAMAGEWDMSEGLRAHGHLGAAGRAAVARRALQAVVTPAARALLDHHAPAQAA